MSSDFKCVLVRDDRLNVTDQINYAVLKGGQNVTCAQYNAISQSNSSHVYNIAIPSESTLIDKTVLWQSTVTLQISGVPDNNRMLVEPGNCDGLAPFPLHQLCSTISSTINNNTVSASIQDILPAILRMNDSRELARYNSMTPTAYDTYGNYEDAAGTINNPLGGYSNVADNDLVPRGAWVLDGVSTDPTFPVGGGVPVVGNGVLTQTVYVRFTVTEPIMLSPWVFANSISGNSAMYGVSNLNFTMNIGQANRVWRTSNANMLTGTQKTVQLAATGFTNSRLLFQFLTPHPSLLLSSKNVHNYYEMPRYISNGFAPIPAKGKIQLSTQTLQLNSIPDKLIVMVRVPISAQTNQNTDSCLCIQGVSIQFNNSSGILSSAQSVDLYRYSTQTGSNQNYLEWSGEANTFAAASATAGAVIKSVQTTGSFLMLEFGTHIQISEDFYSAGSLGNFNLMVQLQVFNQFDVPVTPEICLITVNSGVFICQKGSSSLFTAILSKADVLTASEQEPYHKSDARRLVGGGFADLMKSAMGKLPSLLPKLAPMAKNLLSGIDNKYAAAGAAGLGALGYAKPSDKMARRMM